ncbi:MAG: urease subunit alpha [Dehalococcoidia bacterium]
MPFQMDRSAYHNLYGPTVGDRFRLGDTNLFAKIEKDFTSYGNEVLGGWGKNLRTGMMVTHRAPRDSELDLLITGVIVMDPVLGIFKGDIGIKDGVITGIGRAGNPDIVGGVDLEIGPNTLVQTANGLIATPGGVDSHVHIYYSPKLIDVALSSGLTTLIGAGLNTNSPFVIQKYFEAFEEIPINLGVQGRGASSHPASIEECIQAGACGLKIHEDEGAYPSIIDTCLQVADQYDVSVALHTDGLQESMQVTDTIEAIGGRAIHAYHVEGVGGGHAPDLLRLTGVENIITSSTTPTIPYTAGTYQEHFRMTADVHQLNLALDSDVAALEARIRRQTMAAEDVLHDLGAIPIINSDSQGMGRIGEVITRTWQLADKMKRERRATDPEHDNQRILQYLAKYTINSAITHGVSEYVGSLEPGKMADVVLWRREFFGIKPEMVIKGGFPAWVVSGEGNASIGNCEPVTYGPSFGGLGNAAPALSAFFVSKASLEAGLPRRLNSRKKLLAVRNIRKVSKRHMILNTHNARVEFDLSSNQVLVEGEPATSEAVAELPLNRLYVLT